MSRLGFLPKKETSPILKPALPFAGILAATGFILVLQRDIGTLGSDNNKLAWLYFFLGGGKIKHLLIGLAIIGITLTSLVYFGAI